MKTVRLEDLPLETRVPRGRGGRNQAYTIINPDLNGPDNFGLRLIHMDESFYSPRHHHNFDQYRYMLEGESDDAPEGKLRAGVLGYYPEGAYYGPESGPPRKLLLLQFGSVSRSGLVGRPQMKAAIDVLETKGVFTDGVFRRNPGEPGKPVQDGFEAIWEEVHQRPVAYPAPQYANPILMDTSAFPWVPVDGVDGVSEKPLGTFTSAKLRCACYRLDPGASFAADGRGVYFVLSGSGSVAGGAYTRYTSVYLDDGEAAVFAADEPTEILLMGLPSLGMMGLEPEALAHVAGEIVDAPPPGVETFS